MSYSSPRSLATRSPTPSRHSLNTNSWSARLVDDGVSVSSSIASNMGTISSTMPATTSSVITPLSGGRSPSSWNLRGVGRSKRGSTLRKTRNIVLLGSSMAGKTALCVRFLHDRFEEAYEPTYENSFLKQIPRYRGEEGCEMELAIKDTQGLSEHDVSASFRHELALGVHGYILVYSISSRKSFEIIQMINAKLCNLMGTRNVPRVLVGNKSDLLTGATSGVSGSDDGSTSTFVERQVPFAAGAALAHRWGCPFEEVSARDGTNVERAFMRLLDEIERSGEDEDSAEGCWNRVRNAIMQCWNGGYEDSMMAHSNMGVTAALIGSEAASSPTSSHPIARWSLVASIGAWTCFLAALAGLILSIYLGVTYSAAANNNSDYHELLTWLLFGFCLLAWLVSLVGLYGLRISSSEYLKVYSGSLFLLCICELVVGVTLAFDIDAFGDHVLVACFGGGSAALLQLISSFAAHKLGGLLNAADSSVIDSIATYPNDFQQTARYALYE